MKTKEEQIQQHEQEIIFANHCRQVLDNPAFKTFFDARKAQIFEVFCKSKREDSEKREEAWYTMQNLISLEDSFADSINTGKMAETSLKSMQEDENADR